MRELFQEPGGFTTTVKKKISMLDEAVINLKKDIFVILVPK